MLDTLKKAERTDTSRLWIPIWPVQAHYTALLRKLFDGSAELLLTHLVSDKRLSSAQLRRIRRMLDERPKRGSGS